MKKTIFDIIEPDVGNSAASRAFDRLVALLIVLSVSVVFATTFELSPLAAKICVWLERVASVVFTIEYGLRIWTADLKYPSFSPFRARLSYIFSALAVVDLLAILPFWLPMLLPGSLLGVRAIRLVRLLRIFKLNRYSEAMAGLADVVREKRREIVGSTFFLCLLMLVSSLVIYAAEHDAQPEAFSNAFSGLWWAVATLSTVGYGDIYPVTVAGRIFGAILALLGVAAVAVPTSIISSGLIEKVSRKRAESETKDKMVYCPHCGKRICDT